jgi:PAS domain-containing protein
MAIEKVLECMPQMVVRCDERGKIIYANKKWERYSEKKGEEEIWTGRVHPSDKAETEERWTRHVEEDVPFEITHRLCNSVGEYRYQLYPLSFFLPFSSIFEDVFHIHTPVFHSIHRH